MAHSLPSGDWNPATQAARGGWVPPFETVPSSPPIYMTTAWDMESPAQMEAIWNGQIPGYFYTRDGNPNHEAFAQDVARLEKTEAGLACASGMGALTAVLASLKTGDRVIAANLLYGRTTQSLGHFQKHYGIDVVSVDLTDPAALRAAVTPATKLAVIESISNPLVEVADLPAIAEALGEVPLLVDNTFATPCLLRPAEHGARLVWHSASKYLNGHGDVMLGVVTGDKDSIRRAGAMSSLFGVNANPMECWLASRGLRTLSLRMERVSATALELAEFLAGHPRVSRVVYPGLASHPTHALAKRLLTNGYGGMMSFEIAGGSHGVAQVFQRLGATIPFSPTLADARTTVSYPAGTSHKFIPAAQRAAYGITDGLIRLSVGLEDPRDLRHELDAALR